jgi:uncharacterized membrane protein
MPTSVANVVAKSMTGKTGSGGAITDRDRSPSQPRQLLGANVGEEERVASLVGGALLAGYGLTCRGLAGVVLPLVGGALVVRGLTGNCPAYTALGVSTNCDRSDRRGVEAGAGYRLEESVTINRPPAEVYRFWRRFDNLPKFLSHLEEVRVLDNRRSHWVARAPLGLKVEWQAEVITEVPGRLIGWQSLPGSDVGPAGSVQFEPEAGGQRTRVRVNLKYDPPAGKLGAWFAGLFGESPEQQVREDLGRFRQLLEAGRVEAPRSPAAGRR